MSDLQALQQTMSALVAVGQERRAASARLDQLRIDLGAAEQAHAEADTEFARVAAAEILGEADTKSVRTARDRRDRAAERVHATRSAIRVLQDRITDIGERTAGLQRHRATVAEALSAPLRESCRRRVQELAAELGDALVTFAQLGAISGNGFQTGQAFVTASGDPAAIMVARRIRITPYGFTHDLRDGLDELDAEEFLALLPAQAEAAE